MTVQGVSQPRANAQASTEGHTVRRGDTLSGIANQHGVTTADLLRANPQIRNADLIFPGQRLNLPAVQDRPAAPVRPQTQQAQAPAQQPASNNRMVRVQSGDTLSGIAARHGTTWQELQRVNNIRNPNLIQPGQLLKLPDGVQPNNRPPPAQNSGGTQNPGGANNTGPTRPPEGSNAGTYNGSTPARGTTDTRAWLPVDAPVQNREGNRSAANYNQAINQFAVGNNPRYTPRGGNTYCNIFASDVMQAMGAPLPHWVDARGNPARAGAPGARELNANATNAWLNNQGASHGWRRVSAEEAQRMANAGNPAVASWNNPGGIGHIGVVRPGEVTSRGPALAQAGGRNFNDGNVMDGFGNRTVQYFVHN